MESSLKRRRVDGGYFLRKKFNILSNVPIDVFAKIVLEFQPEELTSVCLVSKTIYSRICRQSFRIPYITKWIHEISLGLLDAVENHRQEYLCRWLDAVKNILLYKEDLLIYASRYGGIKTFKKILSLGVDVTTEQNAALVEAVTYNRLTITKALLKRGADVSARDGVCLEIACCNNSESMVKLLLSLPTVIPNDECLGDAVRYGCTTTVKLLLEDGRVDPGANGNQPLGIASWYGHSDILRLLLKDPRTDPSDGGDVILLTAVERGHYRIVRRLLQDPRVIPSTGHIIAAINQNRVSVLELLLKDGRADPGVLALNFAATLGRYKIVKILLEDRRSDPTSYNNRAIRDAAWGGHLGIVKILLEDGRADPTAEDNYPVYIASKKGFYRMVRLLLLDDRVDPNVALNKAARKGRLNMVKMIVDMNILRGRYVRLAATGKTKRKVRSINRRRYKKIYKIIKDLF